jgi:hypothetical protein
MTEVEGTWICLRFGPDAHVLGNTGQGVFRTLKIRAHEQWTRAPVTPSYEV